MKTFLRSALSPDRFGPSIPPLPSGIILTDRNDGTEWFVTWNQTEPSADGEGYISITDTWSRLIGASAIVYPAYDEPHIDNEARARLFVRGGTLGVDINDLPPRTSDIDDGPIYARVGVNRRICYIYVPDNWVGQQYVLAWSPETLT